MTVPRITVDQLREGDVLLYRPKGIFGWMIRVKTWHRVSHCECFVGAGQSVASRDGIGVNVYPWRNTELAAVLRPTRPFDLWAALKWFRANAQGKPYGWLDLGAFMGLPWSTRGYFCSEFLTLFLRAGGLPVFNAEPAIEIAPFEFLTTELLQQVWSETDVADDREAADSGRGVVSQKSQ